MENKVIRMPYAVASRAMIKNLVKYGHLPYERRHDVKAIEQAIKKSKERLAELLRSADEPFENPPGSPAA